MTTDYRWNMSIKEFIKQSGLKFRQESFSIDDSVNDATLFFSIPENTIKLSDFNEKWKLFAPIIFSYIKYTNNILKQIYKSHKLLLEEDVNLEKLIKDITEEIKEAIKYSNINKLKELQEKVNNAKALKEKSKNKQEEFSLYPIRLQNFIGMLQKILLIFAFTSEGIYIQKHKRRDFSQIKNLDDFLSKKDIEEYSEIYTTIIKKESKTEEFFNLIVKLNNIYQSPSMIGACNFTVTNYPIVSALEIKSDKESIFHEHKIQQIVLAFNNFLKEVEFFK